MIHAKHFLLLVTTIVLSQVKSSQRNPTLVFIDSFTEYLSGHCKEYCNENGIRVIECVSPYIQKVLASQGNTVPETLCAPAVGDETDWAHRVELFGNSDLDNDSDIDTDDIFIYSESDVGIGIAERLQVALNIRGNGEIGHVRNKFLLNERARQSNLSVCTALRPLSPLLM